jgi:pimeloyl-ACP methyl ester carboxylesterase
MSVAVQELLTFFPADGEELFGVLTAPASSPGRSCVVVLGGGQTASTSTGRNRVFVTLARHLVTRGFHAFRFDYHGIGDSTGASTFRLDRPFVHDLEGAIGFLRTHDIDRFVLVGSCFGARTAMAAGHRVDGVEAVVLLAPPLRDFALSERKTDGWSVRDYLSALLRPQRLVGGSENVSVRRYLRFLRSGGRVVVRRLRRRLLGSDGELAWVSPHFLNGIASLVDRRIPTLILYGTEDESYPDFLQAKAGRLGRLLARAGSRVRTQVVEGQVHGFTQAQAQSTIVETVGAWISQVAPHDPSGQVAASAASTESDRAAVPGRDSG